VSASLDLFSTSQTKSALLFGTCADFSPKTGSVGGEYCVYSAPYFAFQKEGKIYGVVQGCCNHWDCPKCGILRAKHEYGRIVVGIQKLAETHKLHFITVTCRGKEMTLAEAETGYLEWTNRLLTNMRIKAKRNGQDWYYVQVTEKQKRGHPHSHILTTFDPADCETGYVEKWVRRQGYLQLVCKPALRSKWLRKSVILAGLGDQYDISIVETAAGASRYVAKYLFKQSMFGAHWPTGWKRVRYSQTFPKLPEKVTDAFVLLSRSDWQQLASKAAVIITDTTQTKTEVLYQLAGNDILVS
jgi:hypothetical protein